MDDAMKEVSKVETINRCPRCQIPATVLKTVELQSDCINQFGHRELRFIAESHQIIKWDPGKKLYHCKNCELDYSSNDHTMERDPSAQRNE